MKKNLVKKILTAGIALLLLIYVGCNVYLSVAKRVNTEMVMYTEVDDTYSTTSYIVKNEGIIPNDSNNQFFYCVDDGSSVAGGETVAYMFENAQDAIAQKEISILEDEIAALQELNSKSSLTLLNPDSIEQKITQSILDYQNCISKNEIIKSKNASLDVAYAMSEKQLATGKVNNFDAKINELSNTVAELKKDFNPSIGSAQAPSAGYFVSSTDGYENYFDYANIEDIDLATIRQGLPTLSSDDSESKPVGKVIQGLNWYVVCEVSADEASKLSLDKTVNIMFPMVKNEYIPATVVAINQADFYSNAALVLKCDYMDSDLANLRNEKLTIQNDTYEGYRVPTDAVHIEQMTKTVTDSSGASKEITKNVQGAYVLYGNELKFKEIVPLGSYSNYIICKKEPSEEELFTGESIKLYDEVVVGGTDLYDGKVIR